MKTDDVFFALLRAGLWGKAEDISLRDVDWESVYGIAREQTVAGFVADGISVMKKADPAMAVSPAVQNSFMQTVLGSEMRNRQMNATLSHLCKVLSENGICALVLKGQGVALDYLQPSHRQPGDIDFFLDDKNYQAASALLSPKAAKVDEENLVKKHLGMHFGDIEVELHGTMRVDFGKRVNEVMDNIQFDLFRKKDFRKWDCGGTEVLLPSIDFDALFIFMHFIQHFYHGGLGLRQICDWTMHLHRFADNVDRELLEHRLTELGMMREWKVFGWLAVNRLGLPADEMPFYDAECGGVVEKVWESMKLSGNFGKKRNAGRDVDKEPYLYRKTKSLVGHVRWIARHFDVSYYNTFRSFWSMLTSGVSAVLKGK